MEQRRTDAEVALELMRLVLDQAGSRRLSPTRTLALYHLCKEAVAYAPEGTVTASYLEDQLKKLLQKRKQKYSGVINSLLTKGGSTF